MLVQIRGRSRIDQHYMYVFCREIRTMIHKIMHLSEAVRALVAWEMQGELAKPSFPGERCWRDHA